MRGTPNRKYGNSSPNYQLNTNFTALILGALTTSPQHTKKKRDFDGSTTARGEPGSEVAPSTVRRAEQGEALPGNSAPKSGPQIEVWRSRLKAWFKSELLAARVHHLENLTFVYSGGPSIRRWRARVL